MKSGKIPSRLVRLAVALLAALCLTLPAWAEESGTLVLSEETAVEAANVAERGDDGADSVQGYVPETYDLNLSGSKSKKIWVGDVLNVTFSAGSFESFVSQDPGIAAISNADPASGTATVTAVRPGKVRLRAVLPKNKKVTLTLKVKDPYLPRKIRFSNSMVTLTVGSMLQLKPIMEPSYARTNLKWSLSNKKVAKVSENGLVTALASGTVKITVKTANNKKASMSVKVWDPYEPSSVSIQSTAKTVSIGESLALTPVLEPPTAQSSFYWSCSPSRIASVSDTGVVTGAREGTARITVKTSNGKKSTITIKVLDPYKPASVAFNESSMTVMIGKPVVIQPVLTPSTARTTFKWSSSKKDIATISSDGTITGHKEGKTKITVKTANGKKATCTVTVVPYVDPTVTCRALLVAQSQFYWPSKQQWEYVKYNRNAVGSIERMLGKVNNADSGERFLVQTVENTRKAQLKAKIAETFADADSNDISLFYISSHGNATRTDDNAGALIMASFSAVAGDYFKLSELRDCLLAVPGKVIVILDTCGSGAAVVQKGESEDFESEARACADFDAAVIQAFAEADPGLTVPVMETTEDGEAVVAKTGELRQENKFYVLCSSRYLESSWATSTESFFTNWLTEGVGSSSSMPADTKYKGNNNGEVDLYEIFSYISAVGDNHPFTSGDKVYYQHVQVYPADTRYPLFK